MSKLQVLYSTAVGIFNMCCIAWTLIERSTRYYISISQIYLKGLLVDCGEEQRSERVTLHKSH